MKRYAAVSFFIVFAFLCAADENADSSPSAAELLARVDANEVYGSISYSGRMIIEYRGKRYVKDFRAWGRGNAESFVEFTNSEDSGTKYLRREGRLYVYSPDTEQVMLISGHLLKESMMGSDLSYEDAIENESLSKRYVPSLSGEDTLGGRAAWVLDLSALRKTESYPKERIWVAKDNFDVLKYELYALSGAKLKEYALVRAERIGGRSFPVESELRDLLRKGSVTRFAMMDVVLDADIDESVFSMRNLER